MNEIGGNGTLRLLMDEAGMSCGGMARAVIAAGAEEGVHLGTTTTSVSRMLDGCQPRSPVPRLVAKVLTRRLGYVINVTECGFADLTPSGDTFDGLQFSPTIDGTIAVVAELSRRDLSRRNFMMGSTFAAAAFAEPAWLAMTSTPSDTMEQTAGARIGQTDVEVLAASVTHFKQLDRRYGGGRVREQLVQFVHRQTRLAQEATFTEQVGRSLYSTLAEATFFAGLTSEDSRRHALAQRYFAQALNLAIQAGDRSFAANVLAEMSRVSVDIGLHTADRVKSGQHATGLARSALHVGNGHTTPRAAAYLHAIEARGLSLLGDHRNAAIALDNARRSFDGPDVEEPGWVSHYGEADLTSDIGQCLRDIGRPHQGLALLTRAADTLPAHRVTARAKTQIHIAAAYLEIGEFDQADRTTEQALTAVGALSSARTLDRVRALQGRARGCGRHRDLTNLDNRITEFLGPDA